MANGDDEDEFSVDYTSDNTKETKSTDMTVEDTEDYFSDDDEFVIGELIDDTTQPQVASPVGKNVANIDDAPITDMFLKLVDDVQENLKHDDQVVDIELTLRNVQIRKDGFWIFSKNTQDSSTEIRLATRVRKLTDTEKNNDS